MADEHGQGRGPAAGGAACLDSDLAARFAEGQLTGEVAALVERHIDQCPVCRRYVSALVKAGGVASGGAGSPVEPVVDPRDCMSLVGVVLKDTYRVVRVIGTGGMGVVYEAEHVRLRRRFAIKVLREAIAVDPEARDRFRREALVSAELGHRHIAQVLDFDVAPNGLTYFVRDLLTGEDLASRLERGPLPPSQMLEITRQIGLALDVAHARGIVHRDLKPANVFLCREPDGTELVKLLDFGVSKIAQSQTQLTSHTSYLGTPSYMAPEQARGDSGSVDARSDIFALGVMAFEMLLGHQPFAGVSVEAVLYQVVHEPMPPVRSRDPRLPEALDSVLARAAAKERAERYPSAGVFVHELELALGGGVPAAVAPPALHPRRRGAILVGLTLALVVASALGMWRAWPRRPPPRSSPVEIQIRLDITPNTAEVRWDGVRIAGAAVFTPADGTVHRLSVKAPGHRWIEREVLADGSQTIVLELAPLVTPVAATQRRARSAASRPRTAPRNPDVPTIIEHLSDP
jgi:tRNA A-37 threonylcarbamoyl transferase component Bud32